MKEQPNYEMIVLARETRGITQSELAERAPSVNQGNLSRMEKGKLSISENALMDIANALDFPKSFFFQQKVKTPISDFYYRKRQSVPKKVLSRLEANMDLIRMGLDKLFFDIELPVLNIPHIELSNGLTPEEAARKIRTHLSLPRGPIKNLVNLLEQNGVVIFLVDSESDKFDGITLFTDEQYPVIFLNENLPNDRKRFTLAHELGHLVLHLRAKLDDRTDQDKEIEANQFAAEFLMPELDIRNDLTYLTIGKLGSLKDYWQVSMRSLVYRAKSLKIITESRATNLYIELSRLGYVTSEPGFVEFDEPKIVKKTIDLLKSELEYSYDDIAEDLCISVQDFLELFMKKRSGNLNLRVIKGKNDRNNKLDLSTW